MPASNQPAQYGGMKMRRVTHKRLSRRCAKKAATFIEFTMILPIFLFMMLFSIDMGSLMLMSGAMNDNVFSTARAGAQIGGAGLERGRLVCNDGSTCDQSTAATAYQNGLDQIPFSKSLFDAGRLRIVEGAVCTQAAEGSYVKVTADYTVRLITPGLGAMLNMINGDQGPRSELTNGYDLTAVGVARCEIYRQ